jgi:putative oxidoreductase
VSESEFESENKMLKLPRPAIWVCVILLTAAFVPLGISKVSGPSAVRWGQRFLDWGYPAGTQYVVGTLEVLGGIAVLVPRWRRVAAAGLIVILFGAVCTHVVYAEFPRVVPPLVLALLALLVRASSVESGAPGIRV